MARQVLAVVAFLVLGSWALGCEQLVRPLTVENNTDVEVWVYVNNRKVGAVPSHTTVKFEKALRMPESSTEHTVTFKDASGKVVSVWLFEWEELEAQGWKVTVSPEGE